MLEKSTPIHSHQFNGGKIDHVDWGPMEAGGLGKEEGLVGLYDFATSVSPTAYLFEALAARVRPRPEPSYV